LTFHSWILIPLSSEVNSANKAGYGKPIDLYSLGCVTVTLLMGFLPARESHKRIDRSGDDLKGMTMELIQHGVTGYPQNFIKRLLVLDEKARLNVKQALLHQWFEFLPEKDELEDRYQKAVDQWIPRPRSDPADRYV
jgi:Serine/threonine protein kinase